MSPTQVQWRRRVVGGVVVLLASVTTAHGNALRLSSREFLRLMVNTVTKTDHL